MTSLTDAPDRALIYQRRQHNEASILAVLPTELLYRVMEHVALSHRLEDAKFVVWSPLPVLLSCCAFVRDAALTCPYLWTLIRFSWPWSPVRRLWTPSLDAVAQHLSRSGSLDLDVRIHIGGYTEDPSRESFVSASLKRLLSPHMYRCHTLVVKERSVHFPETILEPIVQASFFPLNEAMPALQDISLESNFSVNKSDTLGPDFRAPSLRSIKIQYQSNRGDAPFLLPPTEIASVELVNIWFTGIVESNAFAYASVFHNLKFLRIHCEERPSVNLPHAVPLDLLCLQVLDLDTDAWDPLDLLPVLNAPNLKHLHWGGSLVLARQMLLREGCFPRLVTLQLSVWPSLDAELVRFIQSLPTLQELEFPVTWHSIDVAVQLFRTMEPELPTVGRRPAPSLPELRKLVVTTAMWQVRRLAPIVAAMVEMMQKRSEIRGEWFSGRNLSRDECASLVVESIAWRWRWNDLNDWENHTDDFFKPRNS